MPVTAKLGANRAVDGRFEFLVWAPLRKDVRLKIVSEPERTIRMDSLERGYFYAAVPAPEERTLVEGGTRYVYLLDGEVERPDPVSYYQPEGPHGPSELVDHGGFKWEDSAWENPPLEDYVIYELHTGTFTPEGTFGAIVPRLPYLKELGVTAIEVMPVSQFPGRRNWGYDGVYPFAVQNSYGGPGGFKGLVDECHRSGLAVILDVVYNHFGPEGNYRDDFGPYLTDRYKTPWGAAINFDGPHSDGVRRFFIENALYWLDAFHVDALRIDAVHGIFDMGAKHILYEIREALKRRFGSGKYLIAESDLNDIRLIKPPGRGGHGLDAAWNDDFHHALHAFLTAEAAGYYEDFGRFEHITKALKEGFVYSGQYSEFRKRSHGSSSRGMPPGRFVVFSQNHDQVGNRMLGDRLAASLGLAELKLLAGTVLLSPYIPLLFMGEEYGETAPFQYFVSHSDAALVEAVRQGRQREFSSFRWQGEVPDPQAEATFMRSKIDPGLRGGGRHKELFGFYKELIALRKRIRPLGVVDRRQIDIKKFAPLRALTMRRRCGGEEALVAFSFNGAPVEVSAPEGIWLKVFDSSSFPPAIEGGPAITGGGRIGLGPYCFAVFRSQGAGL